MKNIRHFITNKVADSYIHVKFNFDHVQIKIADCDRNVKLDFFHDEKKWAKTSLKKINALIEPLLKVREYLEKKVAGYNEAA